MTKQNYWKNLKNNTIVALSYLCLWLIIDVVDVKLYRFKGFEHELVVGLSIVLISFIIANKNLFEKFNLFLRGCAIAAISIGLTALWFCITVGILLEFHLAIGGNL